MQERRYRPGDVLDDYCPRERRITDHAIVAMIDDEIRRTRCGVCDAEHEYKEAKVPAPRRKTQPPALFAQVLEGMNGPQPPQKAHEAAATSVADSFEPPVAVAAAVIEAPPAPEAVEAASMVQRVAPIERVESASALDNNSDEQGRDEAAEPAEREGGFRRSLIRATFPRPEGQAPPARDIPEFTIHSLHNRRNGQRHANGQNRFRGQRRRPGGNLDQVGPMRFRDHNHGQGNNNGQGQGQGQGGRRRRGGKKNR